MTNAGKIAALDGGPALAAAAAAASARGRERQLQWELTRRVSICMEVRSRSQHDQLTIHDS